MFMTGKNLTDFYSFKLLKVILHNRYKLNQSTLICMLMLQKCHKKLKTIISLKTKKT